MPVVTFLNAIGIKWPYINEDSLAHLATLTREFGHAVEQTHEDATQAVSGIAQGYQGSSTQAMSSGWAHLSATHVKELVAACEVMAAAIDAWAVYVVVQKGRALAQLVELAMSYAAALAAAPETFGASLAALPGLEEIGTALGNSLIQDLDMYVQGKVIEAASKPLVARVEAMLQGLDWSSAPGGVDPLGGGTVALDTAVVEQHVGLLRSHAATMRSHAENFLAQAAGIEF
jgi:hypothetical protein